MVSYADQVRQRLIDELGATEVTIVDNSAQHAGHTGNTSGFTDGTHLEITVTSPKFAGLNIIDQHRLVHKALKQEMAERIHALVLSTHTPD
jgi:BolA family transcriptional regulator, general stress-responsive regulator